MRWVRQEIGTDQHSCLQRGQSCRFCEPMYCSIRGSMSYLAFQEETDDDDDTI